MTLTVHHYLILGFLLFSIGIAGVLSRKNLILIFVSLELMLNSVNIIFLAFARHLSDGSGQIAVIFFIAIAAAEAAVGLAIVLMLFHHRQGIEIDQFFKLKG